MAWSVPLWPFIFAFFVASVMMIGKTGPDQYSNEFRNERHVIVSYADPPPPPRFAAQYTNGSRLYIAVVDDEYQPSPIQCALEDAWIRHARGLGFVDGVELYSSAAFVNENCGMVSISVNSTDDRFNLVHNPSCVITQNMLTSFLARSNAEWLLVVGDGAYVDVSKLKQLMESVSEIDPLTVNSVFGQCQEVRDYFQTFVRGSGVLMSRATVKNLVKGVRTPTGSSVWEVSCAIEIDWSEALAHSMNLNGIYAIQNDDSRFLGHPFSRESDYASLMEKEFKTLVNCPDEYARRRVCHSTVQAMNSLVVWAGAGSFMDKLTFIQRASSMISSVPDDVHFIYDTYLSELCKI